MSKPMCKDCTHCILDREWYCCMHLHKVNGVGCNDYWPADRDPRCDECRLWVEKPYSDFPEGRCHHSAMQTEHRLGTITADWYCENWRAR